MTKKTLKSDIETDSKIGDLSQGIRPPVPGEDVNMLSDTGGNNKNL